MLHKLNEARLGVIGLGYVDLPLTIKFGKHYPTVGFDINKKRAEEFDGWFGSGYHGG